ncbi:MULTISPECIES: ECF transporter S component [unclassified Parvimonas]|uniref:ECF transporter S component n=1 Tax=unclassified Parvimonas TaxID=1151464 RepID=UPI0039E71CF5
MKNISTKSITKIGILSAIVIILSLSPIGFIPLGPVRITTVHIPIILIALIEKPTVSFFVGLIFGLFSFIQHLSGISTLSFMFINPMVSVLPRALIGVGTYYTFNFIKKYIKNIFNVVFASMIGTMINTFGVLSMAYIFCANQIYEVLKINPAKFLVGVAISNGIPEIIVCSALVPMIYKSLQKILKF